MQIRQVTHLELVPVVELEPGRFGKAEGPPGPWSDEQCAQYWTDCLAQADLDHLVPVHPRSWLVALDDLLERRVLRRILRPYLDDLDDMVDGVGCAFSGGFALYDGAEPLLLPQCCGDLGNLSEWQAVSGLRGRSSARVWIGHPELVATYVAPRLELRQTSESDDDVNATIVSVDPYALSSEVERVRARLQNLVSYLAASLPPADFPNAEACAAGMLGLDEYGTTR